MKESIPYNNNNAVSCPYNYLVFTLLLFIMGSCEKKSPLEKYGTPVAYQGEKIAGMKQSSSETVTVAASYTTEGIIKGMGVRIEHEITYLNNVKLSEIQRSKSGPTSLEAEMNYDTNGNMTSLKSIMNGQLSVEQADIYEEDRLIEEFRTEHTDGKIDTTLYRYLYPQEKANSLTYYRTNNGDTVTVITVDRKGLKEEEVSTAYKYNSQIFKNRVYDENDNILEEESFSISESWNDKTKMDTSEISKNVMEYDKNNNLTSQIEYYEGQILSRKELTYDNGIVKTMNLSRGNKPPKRVVYRRK